MIHSNSFQALNDNRYARRSVHVRDRMAAAIGANGKLWAARMRGVVVAAFRPRFFWGMPAFFDFEREAPVHQRLGPGLSRASDSFWPIPDW